MSQQTANPESTIVGDVQSPQPHDSAGKHVTGSARYTDDLPTPEGCLHLALGLASISKGKIDTLDLTKVRAQPGVIDVLTAADTGDLNDISPAGLNDEPLFAADNVEFHGQPLFVVVATERLLARRAVTLARTGYTEETATLDINAALASASTANKPVLVTEPLTLKRGDIEATLAASTHRISSSMQIGGQDHFYLEGQIALAIPGEDQDMLVYSSTQHPSEVQHMVAHVLGVPSHAVTIRVRRMGGGFGGKETQANLFACIAALAARKTGQPVKFRPDRDEDMICTGKRHDFKVDYDVGFDEQGQITAFRGRYAARCGFSADLSGPVTDRALFHADNAYFYPAVHLQSLPLKTNTVSNTAFRGFGGPQGLLAAERVIEEIAYALKTDPLDIRLRNLYADPERNVTPYHQVVEDNILKRLIRELEFSSDYRQRRQDILAFNSRNPYLRKGIALTPVKFGISFTATWLNQAGALVHVYQDGSILLNHGGTEMGQGLFIKVAQVVANEFQVNIDRVHLSETATDKVPNTSATAASSGSDLNGMAALEAVQQIKDRLADFAAAKFGVDQAQVRFSNGAIKAGTHQISFDELVKAAYQARVHLSATGFYKTPDIHWDRETGTGKPFFYFAYGAAVSEVCIDTLTGEYRVDRTDILHDVGESLNPAVDKGQVEGGFVQGMGWLTTEELYWDDKGKLHTHAPSTYKIPLASDCPREFNVELAEWSSNPARTIRRSKAVGEPPLMLAVSVVEALSMAVASTRGYEICPRLDTPVTPEVILKAIRQLKKSG